MRRKRKPKVASEEEDFVPSDEDERDDDFVIDDDVVNEDDDDVLPPPVDEIEDDIAFDTSEKIPVVTGKKRKRKSRSGEKIQPKKPKKKKRKVKLANKLLPLGKSELVDLLVGLADESDDMHEIILSRLPTVDFGPIEKELGILKNKVFRAFPYNRYGYGSNRNHYSYNRVRPALSNFRKVFTKKLGEVKKSKDWKVVRTYLADVAPIVNELPVFDLEKDNGLRNGMLKATYKQLCKAKENDLASQDDYDDILGEMAKFEHQAVEEYVDHAKGNEVESNCKDFGEIH